MGARIHTVFEERLADLATQSGQCSLAESKTDVQRVWMVPTDSPGNPFDIPGMHQPSFDRSAINSNYQEVCSSVESGGVGDAGSLKVQLDTVACMERAYRFRHASHIRNVMHAAARHKGHSNGRGIFYAVQTYAQDLLKAAGEK